MQNQRQEIPPRGNYVDQRNAEYEIGVWDPSSTQRSSLSSSSQNHSASSYVEPTYPSGNNGSGVMSASTSSSLAQSQNSYGSYPRYNLGYNGPSPTLQRSMNSYHTNNTSDIYYGTSHVEGYGSAQQPNSYAGSQRVESAQNYSNSRPVSQTQYSLAMPPSSSSLNWRSRETQEQVQSSEHRSINSGSHNDSYQSSANPNSYTNPLSQSEEHCDLPEEVLVSRLHDAAAQSQHLQEMLMKKPSTISKAALAAVKQNLDLAAAPFKSAETLKQFRNLHLGIDVEDARTSILETSQLSAEAVAFVPRQKSQKDEVFDSDVQAGDGLQDICLSKLDFEDVESGLHNSQSLASERRSADRVFEVLQSASDRNILSGVRSSLEVAKNAFEADVCRNPMDGPVLNARTSRQPLITSSPVQKSRSLMSMAAKYHVGQSGPVDKQQDDSQHQQTNHKNSSVASLSPRDMLTLSLFPFGGSGCGVGDTSESHLLLGLAPLSILGYESESASNSLMQSKVKLLPGEHSAVSTASDVPDEKKEELAMNVVCDCINRITCDPASFDSVVPTFVETLRGYVLQEEIISKIVDKIYEMCVVEPNFRYLGARLLDTLSRTDTGLKNFRKMLLSKAQEEFKVMDEALKGDEEQVERTRGFIRFVAELFLSLMMERANRKLERFAVLGRALIDVIRKLIEHPNDDNIQCAVRVMKLTVVSMEDSLKDDGKNSISKLDETLNSIAEFADATKVKEKLNETTNLLLKGFIKLRADNWGRGSTSDSPPGLTPDPNQYSSAPHLDENFYMNEPVFFTPAGTPYTAADAADPEFYTRHLAPFQPAGNEDTQSYDQLADGNHNYFYPDDADEYDFGGQDQPYQGWSAGDADQIDPANAEDGADNYDDEFEKFLQSIGQ